MKGNKDIIQNIEENKNYIIAEINIEEDDINKDKRILNSFEEYKKIHKFKNEEDMFMLYTIFLKKSY